MKDLRFLNELPKFDLTMRHHFWGFCLLAIFDLDVLNNTIMTLCRGFS